MFNLAIDGPAGAGKSTIAKIVSEKLGYIYVDTGAMYRTMALACIRAGIDSKDKDKVILECGRHSVSLKFEDGVQVALLDGENVNQFIRNEEVGNMASSISVYSEVRDILVAAQQNIAEQNNVVMDGRDIGTVVLPNADLKIYLTATARTRALRRYKELTQKGVECNIDDIEHDIIERDYRDMHRKASPLRQAEDAVLVDSSEMTVSEVADKIICMCKK